MEFIDDGGLVGESNDDGVAGRATTMETWLGRATVTYMNTMGVRLRFVMEITLSL